MNCELETLNIDSEKIHRSSFYSDSPGLFVGFLIATGVCLQFFGGGRLLLLDWSFGPHTAIGNPSTGFVSTLFVVLLNTIFGSLSTWIPIFFFFPLAMFAMGRLVVSSLAARLSAGVLYCINPFVFSRIYVGHFPLLIGYALLPLALKSVLKQQKSEMYRHSIIVMWWIFLTSISPHYSWIFGVVVLISSAVEILIIRKKILQKIWYLIGSVLVYAIANVYIFLPSFFTSPTIQVGEVSLKIYRTLADPILGLYPNALGFYGFWRIGPGPVLPKAALHSWFFILLLIVIVASLSLPSLDVRRNKLKIKSDDRLNPRSWQLLSKSRIEPAWFMLSIGITGYILSLGDQGIVSSLFRWSYFHVPFFQIMREPQKFLMLWVLCLCVFFGWGVSVISKSLKSRAKGIIAISLIGFGLPILYTPTIFNGLNGQIKTSDLPSSYQAANKLMGPGEGYILYLPWHQYMAYPFTENRVVANLGPTLFSRSVIFGDNVQANNISTQSISRRSMFLENAFNRGSKNTNFSSIISSLGIKYVVLSKTTDWRTYSWIANENGLKLVSNNSVLEVWLNLGYVGLGTIEVGASNSTHISQSRFISRISSNKIYVGAGNPGLLNIAVPYVKGWSFNGSEFKESPFGTLQISVDSKPGVATYQPAKLEFISTLISAAAIFCILLFIILYKRKLVNEK